MRDRIWISDRLDKHGWKNYYFCPLCKREQETGPHLFFKCRYTIRLWNLVVAKLGLVQVDTSLWHLEGSVNKWMFWNERNAHVFRHRSRPPPILLNIILEEVKLWIAVGAKKLGEIILRE